MLFSILIGCVPELELLLDTAQNASETDASEEVAFLPTAQVEWGETQLLLHMKNTSGYDFQFGIVESSEECAQDIDFGCWTGENCDDFDPYTSADEEVILGPYCHPAQGDGVALSLNYSSSISSVLLLEDVVSNGVQTAFPPPPQESEDSESESYEFKVTYYLVDLISGKCWAWGINPNYFSDRNCTIPLPLSSYFSAGNPNIVVLDAQ
ncbi:MAG: hypothetical protein CMK59_03385 [Proteobacteria bacterium]|nr:hypothetical protein [Pseudomonadota bacterium]